jgi:GntR family transcriptional regulator/MocR family aminotransferase
MPRCRAKQIEQGIARLSDAIDDAVDDPSADVNALLVRKAAGATAGGAEDRAKAAPSGPQFSPPTGSNGAAPPPREDWRSARNENGQQCMIVVSKIYRYPIKGLSAQPLSSVALETDKPFPHDRIFALARPGAPIDRATTRNGRRRACSSC